MVSAYSVAQYRYTCVSIEYLSSIHQTMGILKAKGWGPTTPNDPVQDCTILEEIVTKDCNLAALICYTCDNVIYRPQNLWRNF